MDRHFETWKTYEEVAQHLLNQLANHFGLGRVEGKQIVPGDSGVNWEIDAKGILKNKDGFLVIECRRYTKSRLSQEHIAGLAFRIQDTGAVGGIIVSPFDLQIGAKILAEQTHILHVTLDPASTTSDFMLRFLNQIFIGKTERVSVSDFYSVEIIRNGKVIE
jgi:hypothetical protein